MQPKDLCISLFVGGGLYLVLYMNSLLDFLSPKWEEYLLLSGVIYYLLLCFQCFKKKKRQRKLKSED